MHFRKKSQRGSEVIEVSFILVPLFGITFLLLDLSMAIFVRATFQHAVLEGVRYAITGANDTGPCQDDSIRTVVKNNALGFLSNTAGNAAIHVHFINPVTGGVSNNSSGNIVGVTVEGYPWNPWGAYQHSPASVNMWARGYDLMESVPGAPACISKLE